MGYKAGSNYTLIKRSISGSPLRGGVRKYTAPYPRQAVSPAQYIDAKVLNIRLPEILRSTEHLQGIIHGEIAGGVALFAVTNERILLIAQSASLVQTEDISLDMIAGLDLKRQGALTFLTIFTNSDTHTIRTLDRASARHFVESVDICHQTQHIDRDLW